MSSKQDLITTKGKAEAEAEAKEVQNPPEPDEHADANDFHSFLVRCADEARTKHDQYAPYIHPVVLSFSDGSEKANWRAYFEDAGERDVFSQLWKSKKAVESTKGETPDVWLALCSTKASNWVGKGVYKIEDEVWHAWAVAVVKRKDGKGRHVLIFDPDKPEELKSKRYRAALLGSQRSFVEAAMRAIDPRGGKPTGGLNGPALMVWLGGGILDGTTTRGKDQCVAFSTQWLKRITGFISEGSDGDEVIDGVRFKGYDFVRLQS